MSKRAFATLGFALAFPACGLAQQDAPVAKPEVKIGDRWVYRRMDYETNTARSKYEMRVVFAERGVIQMVSTQRSKDEEVDTTYTSEWNAVTVPGRVFNPHTGWFRFPLRVGDAYQASFETILPRKEMQSRNERTVKVVGWEEVTVPAGKFRALKIVSEGFYQRLDHVGTGSARTAIWYVPGVKRWVKITNENRPTGRGRGEYFGEELVDYKVQ